MIEIEAIDGPGMKQLEMMENDSIKVGFMTDRRHQGNLEVDDRGSSKRDRTIPEVAKRVSEGDDKPFFLEDRYGLPFPISGVPPRPFLKEGVDVALDKSEELLRGVARGNEHAKKLLAEELHHEVLEKMFSYYGDQQNKRYIRNYKQGFEQVRLYRTGVLARNLETKWDSQQ